MSRVMCVKVFIENQKLHFQFDQPLEAGNYTFGDVEGEVDGHFLSFPVTELLTIEVNDSKRFMRNHQTVEVERETFEIKQIQYENSLFQVSLNEFNHLLISRKVHTSDTWRFYAEVERLSLSDEMLSLEGKFNSIITEQTGENRDFHLIVFAEQQPLAKTAVTVNEEGEWSSHLNLSELKTILHSYTNLHFWLEETNGETTYRARLQRHTDLNQFQDVLIGTEDSSFWGRVRNSKYFTVSLKRQSMLLEEVSVQKEEHTFNLAFTINANAQKIKSIRVIFPTDGKIFHYTCIETAENHYQVRLDCDRLIETLTDEGRSKGTFILQGITENGVPVLLTMNAPKLKYRDTQSIIPFNHVPYEVGMFERKRQGLVLRIRKGRIVRTIYYAHDNVNQQVHVKGASLLRGIPIDQQETEVNRVLVIRNRLTESDARIPLPYVRDSAFSYVYRFDEKDYEYSGFNVIFTIERFFEQPGIYDFYVAFENEDFYIERKLGFSQFVYKKDEYIIQKNSTLFTPTEVRSEALFSLTPGGNLKFEILHHPKRIEPSLSLDLSQEIWLIGERPDTAQDTGYHFFKYCREHYPDRQIFYAIDGHSKDYDRVKVLGNVVTLNSADHLFIARHVTHVFGSHDLEYFLPYKLSQMKRVNQIKKIFLQHGVMGRKSAEYHKFYYTHPFDLVITSSDEEKNMFMDHFKYQENEIAVTGLSRFDFLYQNHEKQLVPDKNVILLMPTWREWLHDSRAFEESRYFKEYLDLLRNDRLKTFLEETNSELWFYPHYRMQPFLNYFKAEETSRVKIIELGTKSVQELLMSTHLLITDYSSVSFDYSFMKKPVIFFHFDFKRFFRKGILRPLEETFLGSIVHDTNSLIDEVIKYEKQHFKEDEDVVQRRHLILKYVDDQNCARIIQAVKELDEKSHLSNNHTWYQWQSKLSLGKVKTLRYIFRHKWILQSAVLSKKILRKLKLVK